jgi:DNA-binding helix-hairpin-helix protein with protein kinase domain
VILGDLNDGNILVGHDAVPWFIDTDSYQIGQYPSPVARLPFVHPDLMGGTGVNTVFRRVEHDLFALAALVFKILFIGSSPYLGVPEFEEQDHRQRVFQFRMRADGDPRIRNDAPMGNAPFIWSQLPPYLRETFWKVFRECDDTHLDARGWQALLRRYANDLRREPGDPRRVSTDLFPTRLKDPPPPGPGWERRACDYCTYPLNAKVGSRTRYCVTCARKTIPHHCVVAGCRRLVHVPVLELNSPRRQTTCNFHQKILNR